MSMQKSAESAPQPYALFSAIGIEIEYMVVDAASLDVLPVVDKILTAVAGKIVGEVERGAVAWSNELAMHVLELKSNSPATAPAAAPDFQVEVTAANAIAARFGGMLLPGAMHPWMIPQQETVIWPHDYSAIYAAFDRVFGCQGHGWGNLQSTHLNLPFANDAEFGRLHAAMRLLLPILPAVAASSPLLEGQPGGQLDRRLELYRHNCRRFPEVTGRVVPEPVFTAKDYRRQILAPMYDAIAPYDPEGILQHEWLNARGIIARFERGALELRVLDVQECPRADLAIANAIWHILQRLCSDAEQTRQLQKWPVEPLEEIMLACITDGEQALITDSRYLAAFGFPQRGGCCRAAELWQHLVENWLPAEPWTQPLQHILRHGSLARRILDALGNNYSRSNLCAVYRRLAACLANDQLFTA